MEPHDLLTHTQVTIGQAVSGVEGDRLGGFHNVATKRQWDRTPGSKVIRTPRIHQSRLAFVSLTMVSRSREGDTTRYRQWDVTLGIEIATAAAAGFPFGFPFPFGLALGEAPRGPPPPCKSWHPSPNLQVPSAKKEHCFVLLSAGFGVAERPRSLTWENPHSAPWYKCPFGRPNRRLYQGRRHPCHQNRRPFLGECPWVVPDLHRSADGSG